mmetsp:Transcript_15563/g.25479  ORF Transcript_15563/g.25479 Transcript_15563/m.25479 type:complete len:687 (+) Transcript_15563:308-2368(+)|eukprot:CAMPEP_0203764610 /NCGR_PEP_ID=MMETSP0098-20131031/17889_1 /ASSEMBLY_ACC=CAM_ASM_000208 /TAXON_ID=96639 /ORGANISM=" , Strain NY0313808BC1" /LENGTH=686 /DNA_ID=CAMNT_0050660665 /DNA_START=303 /DNA_END=2363 /DNA_ORIENTATION=+
MSESYPGLGRNGGSYEVSRMPPKKLLGYRKSSKKDFKERLESVCARHNKTSEEAKMPVKGCRKVTYILEWGRVDVPECIKKEKGAVKVIPNGFKVVFEASNYVWIGQITYSGADQGGKRTPLYQVFPVDADGKPEIPGSGWLDNISAAFRKALSLHNGSGQGKDAHRPNGRLYLGIFYSTVQEKLKDILRAEPARVEASLREEINLWLETRDTTATTGLSAGIPRVPSFRGNDNYQYMPQIKQESMNAQDMATAPYIQPQHNVHARGPPPPPPRTYSGSNLLATPPPVPYSMNVGIPVQSPVGGTGWHQQHSHKTNGIPESRKRHLAEGGQALLKFATMTNRGTKNDESLEEVLATLLDKIKSSRIASAEEGKKGPDESTLRMLKMLKEIKQELVNRGNVKRQRTCTDHSSDVASETSGSHGGAERMYRGNSGSNLYETLYDEQQQQDGPYYGNTQPLQTNLSGMMIPPAPGSVQSSNNSQSFMMGSNPFLDLEDFHMDAQQPPPCIVGCHLSHEGLFFQLAPSAPEGFSEEQLADAMTSLRIPAASSIVRATLQAADVDNNGRVSLEEFLVFLRKREEELKVMFDSIDRDKDGCITLRDLKWARDTGKLMENASDEELEALLEWMDTLENAYEDGKIHFEEFRTGMILLPPSTTISDIIKHFREKGKPQAKYSSLKTEPVDQNFV